MNPLMAWSLVAFVASITGCVGVWWWDLRSANRATETTETEPVASPTPAHDPQKNLKVDLPGGQTFVFVLGPSPLDPDELTALRVLLIRAYGPPLGLYAYSKVLDAYTAHEARDLDTELASLGEN